MDRGVKNVVPELLASSETILRVDGTSGYGDGVLMRFATNCPPEGCPPDDAEPVNGDVIRFVKHDPPTADDMETYADKGQGKPDDDPCRLCALSVLRRLADVPVARKAMPWFRKQMVALAPLSPVHGVIKQTGPYKWHYSFWVEATHGTSIHEDFKVVPS